MGNSKAKLTKQNVQSYYWEETTHAKGSNEIISAVYNFLLQVTFNEEVKILRVISDGSSGQNKNTGMVAMLGKWLYTDAPRHIKKVELIFPVVGHSFIPPDRVFAKIEKTLKTKEVITSPLDYVSVLEENATCTNLASVPVYDWKKGYDTIIKPTNSWHFPFMKSKRFFLTRTMTDNVLVQGEVNYNSEINEKKVITKKNKKITMIQPGLIQPNKIIPKRAKLQDVVKLLTTHFGNKWQEMEILKYYKNIQERAQTQDVDNLYEDDGDACDLCEGGFEEISSHV